MQSVTHPNPIRIKEIGLWSFEICPLSFFFNRLLIGHSVVPFLSFPFRLF